MMQGVILMPFARQVKGNMRNKQTEIVQIIKYQIYIVSILFKVSISFSGSKPCRLCQNTVEDG